MESTTRVSASLQNEQGNTTSSHNNVQGVTTTNKPAHRVKAGPISATIWANEGTKSEGEATIYYTVTLQRTYKDGDEWKHTNSLRTSDLPKAQLVLNKAYEWLALSEQ